MTAIRRRSELPRSSFKQRIGCRQIARLSVFVESDLTATSIAQRDRSRLAQDPRSNMWEHGRPIRSLINIEWLGKGHPSWIAVTANFWIDS
jgi:hypothetical protein